MGYTEFNANKGSFQNDGHAYIVRQLKVEMHTEYRLMFFIKKIRLSVAKLKKMHMILFD